MNITNYDEIRKVGVYNYASYQSDKASDIIDKFKNGLADAIFVAPYRGFKDISLDCLLDLKGLKAINIQQSDLALDVLYDMPQLEYLTVDETKQTLDFERLKNLTTLSIDWHKKLFKNADLSNLKVLALSKYKSTTNDLTDFPYFNHLQRLVLTQGTISSLNGISRLSELNDMALHYLAKLEHLGELDLPELKKFRAENCKRLAGYEQLGACLNLEDLDLHRCGTIKSVEFIRNLKKLKSFRFNDTEVADGDLGPLLGLEDVYFTEKKHYSHKLKDFNQALIGVDVNKPA